MIKIKENFIEKLINKFIGKELKNIGYDNEFVTGSISQNLLKFYVSCFDYYYAMLIIALILYGIVMVIKIQMGSKNAYNIPKIIGQTFAMMILYFSFPFLFNFFITICSYITDHIFSIDQAKELFDQFYGKESYFNDILNPELESNLNDNEKTMANKLVDNTIGTFKATWAAITHPGTVFRGAVLVFVGIYSFTSYFSLLIVRFIGLSMMFILAPIILPLTLFGYWGMDLLDKYIKTIINLSSWVIVKACIDRVMFDVIVKGSNRTMIMGFMDDLFFLGIMVAYGSLLITVPFICSYFIGGINLSPTVALSTLVSKKAFENGLKSVSWVKNKGVKKGINAIKNSPIFSFGGKK
jgi:hypothetical protein